MLVNSDFSDMLKLLGNNNVRHLVLGGHAVVQYPEPRYTESLATRQRWHAMPGC